MKEKYAEETDAFRSDTFAVLFFDQKGNLVVSLTVRVNHGSLIYFLFPWFHLQSSVVHIIDPQIVYEINAFWNW